MKSIVLSLPVPDMSPGFQRANHQLFAGFASARAAVRGFKGVSIESLPREILDRYHDAAIAGEIAERRPDLAGLSLYVWNSDRALRLAGLLRDMGITAAAGGPEAAALLTEPGREAEPSTLPFDYVFRGEGEDVFLDLLSELSGHPVGDIEVPRDGNLSIPRTEYLAGRTGRAASPCIRESSGPVDFTTFVETFCRVSDEYRYDGLAYLEVERGCPFSCSYCSYAKGRNVLTSLPMELFSSCIDILFRKPIEELYLLAPTLNRIPRVFRERLSFLASRQEGRENPVKLFGEVRPELLDREDLELMYRAGFRELELGIQTLNTESTARSGKRRLGATFLDLAERMLELGIRPILDFILGLPGDSMETMIDTVEALDSRGLLSCSSFYRLQVLPGTDLREEYRKKGWRFQAAPPYFTLENATSTEEEIREVYRYLDEEKDHSYEEELSPDVPGGVIVLEHPGDEAALLGSPYLHGVSLVRADTYPADRLREVLSSWFSAHPEVFHRVYLRFPQPEAGELRGERILAGVRELERLSAAFPNGYDRYRTGVPDRVLSKRVEVLLPPQASDALIRSLIAEGLDLGFYLDGMSGMAGFSGRLSRYLEEWGLPTYVGRSLTVLS